MPFQGDPYRTLGVPQGASLNEIRSAYRRLAKQHHPDAAGERALPRFLAIQAAYERLVDGEGRLRVSRGQAGASPGARPRADRRRPTGPMGGRRPGAEAGPATERRRAWESQGRRAWESQGRQPRRARPGTTSYDEAAEIPLDPPWDGSAWYGPSSGTFWTLNPREYADPRKHGPEYQARASRDVEGEAPAAEGEAPPAEDAGSGTVRGSHGAGVRRGPEAPRSLRGRVLDWIRGGRRR